MSKLISDEAMAAAYAFVESIKSRADAYSGPAPLWHGWALREAYLAGRKDGAAKERETDAPEAKGKDGA